MSLTDTEIKRAKPRDKSYRLSDSGGMYLWITPSGGRLWRWAYLHERKEKLMSLGKYPDVSLAGAREQHNSARRLLASGADPMAQRKSAKHAERTRDEKSFSSVAAKWLEHWQDGKSHGMLIQRDGGSPQIFCQVSVRGRWQRSRRRR